MQTNKLGKQYLMELIAMCGLAASAAGILINTGGVFYTPIANDLGVGRGDVAMMMTILSIACSFSGLLTARAVKKLHLKPMIYVSSVLMVGGTFAMSLCNALWQMYLLSVIRGFAGGLIGFVIISIILNNWFIKDLGLMTSIALAFSGVAGTFLSPILSGIIQSSGWQRGFFAMGIMMLVGLLPALVLPITYTPEESGLKQYGFQESSETSKGQESAAGVKKASGWKVLFVCLSFSLLANIPSSFVPHLPSYADSIGLAASTGALMLSAGMLANIVGKILIGAMSDRIGTGLTLEIGLAAMLCAAVVLKVTTNITVLVIASFFCGLSYAISAVGRVILIKDMYGRERYSEVYPKLNFAASMMFAICGSVYGFLFDQTGSYNTSFYLLCVIAVVLAGILYIGYFTGGRKGK